MNTKSSQTVTAVRLVDGLFSAEESGELLMKLIQCKIHYHELNNLRSLETHGKPDIFAQHRLPELYADQQKIQQLISYASQHEKILKITSAIRIEIMDDRI